MSKLLQGYSRTYQSCDTLYENETEFPPELINDLNSSGFPPYILVLKKHSSIMLLRNLDPAGGHCNGTRYMVVNLHNHLIEADVADGTHAGIRIMIPRIPLTTTEDYPFSFSRKQFPLKLAFERTNPKEWLCEICEANGWKHEQSPIIWRELVDRGGKGVLIGGSNEFEEYAYGYYGVTIDLDGKIIENQAKSVLAEKLPASSCSIDNVVILGSISNDYLIELDKTLVREFDCAVVGPATFSQPLNDIFHQQSWLKKEYVNEVSSRKHVNEMNLRHPTYHLIGHAITTTLNYWWNGLSSNAIFSATLISDGKQNSSVFNLNSFRLQSALNSLEAKVPV
ncbi:ATP-dependent DNA helicase PIF1-like [Octopus vulgaris]|uniref:ATP-dependent DNA helicase PIF1-like n=1 Tax=Octopus vulgaris TaxID=6645 RepID=A0AA36BLC5_OCTVU|nr:ATP-dependent DNA helicase PIF1-like [Octopus vulgaris]